MTTYKQEKIGDYIQTYTGNRFFINEPSSHDINIVDIAHSLSRLARFTGHTEKLYTVGEHSLRCFIIAKEKGFTPLIQLYALLHDASESIMNDVSRPVKQNLQQYKDLEDKISDVMWEMAGVPSPTEEDYEIIKAIDNTMVVMEMSQLMNRKFEYADTLSMYKDGFEKMDLQEEYDMDDVKSLFIISFYGLKRQIREMKVVEEYKNNLV